SLAERTGGAEGRGGAEGANGGAETEGVGGETGGGCGEGSQGRERGARCRHPRQDRRRKVQGARPSREVSKTDRRGPGLASQWRLRRRLRQVGSLHQGPARFRVAPSSRLGRSQEASLLRP